MADGVVEYILRLTDKTKAGTRSAVQGSEQLENQTKQTTQAVDKLGDESAQTSRQLDRMGKQSRGTSAGLTGLSRGLGGALSSVSGLAGGVGGLVAALGVGALAGSLAAATRAMFDFGQEIADLRNDITDASTRSGIAADTLQGLRLAAEGAGLSFGSLFGGLDQLGRRMVLAAEGGNATAEAFAALGVDVVDSAGELRSVDSVFRETVNKLNSMENGAQKTALALDVFGRSGGKILQALSGSELADFVALASEFGVNVGPKAAESAGKWQRASEELSTVLKGLKGRLFDAIGSSDLLDDFSEGAILAFAAIEGAIEGFSEGFENAFARMVAPFESLISSLSSLIEGLEKLGEGDFTGSLKSLENALDAVVRAAKETPEAVASVLTAGVVEAGFTAGFRGAERASTQGMADVNRLRELRSRSRSAGTVEETPEERRARIEEEERKRREASRRAGGAPPAQAVDIDAQLAAMFGNEILATSNRTIRQVSQVGRAGGVVGVDLEAQRANQATLDALTAETRAGRLEAAQTGIGVAGQVLGGDLGGGISSVAGAAGLAGLGVAGAAVSGLQFIGDAGAEGIRDTLEGVKDGLIAALEALPELIGQVLPQFAVSLVAELIPALISNAPDIFKALLVDLPLAIASAIARLLGLDRAAEGVARFAGQTEFRQNVAALGTVLSGRDVTGAAREELRDGGNRSQFGRSAARTASDGQASSARASDRLSVMSSRRRRSAATVQTNPFDQLAQQFDSQFGTFGRAQSTTIGA